MWMMDVGVHRKLGFGCEDNDIVTGGVDGLEGVQG